jgi:hypothetical protein
VWFTEYGCPAVDKGTNQPNKFVDPKSSESGLPRYSNGRRDDLIQRRYLQAVRAHWSDEANNPVSPVYGGPMVDLSRAFVWAFDVRPFPAFPTRRGLWSDGENFGRGHWLNGRATARSLSEVVSEICRGVGLDLIDVSRLHGVIHGYVLSDVGSARAALQPLMQAYGFDASERNGILAFRSRSAWRDAWVDARRVTAAEQVSGDVVIKREPTSELPSRVRATYVEAEGVYATRAVEAADPGQASASVSQTSLALVITPDDAQAMVDRWLAETRVALDGVQFGLPPSASDIGPGDVVEMDGARYRVDRLEAGIGTRIEAVRTDPSVFVPVDRPVPPVEVPSFAAETPVEPVFLDIPVLSDGQVEHAPVIAVSQDPWQGPVAVYRSSNGDSYEFNTLVETPAVVGVTLDPIAPARPDLWDGGPAVRVRLRPGGAGLLSASRSDVLNGANLAAIGSGSPSDWEILQFGTAELIAPETYAISGRLRGLAGTDASVSGFWPAGSIFVLLTRDLGQLNHPPDLRGLGRSYRIGPLDRDLSDPIFVERREAFAGIGLRPLAPVHLRERRIDGGRRISWIRRTRIGGDSWVGYDVPLGEVIERYLLRVSVDTSVRREVEIVGAPVWDYPAALMSADGAGAALSIEVAQISEVFGPGPATRIVIDV